MPLKNQLSVPNARVPVLKNNSFVSGVVEDILTISHVEEFVMEKDNSKASWTAVEKYPKGKKKNNKKDIDVNASVKSNKKGSKVDQNPIKGKSGQPKNGGAVVKNGDVGSSPSPFGRRSNQIIRTVEAIKNIADGSQRTILDSKHFVKL